MTRHLAISLILFVGQMFGQKVLKFKISDMTIKNVDTLIISPNYFGPRPQTFQLRNIKEEFLFVKYYNDTLNLEPKPYSSLSLTGLKKIPTDTIDISFLQLNKFQFADTVVFSVEKRHLFSKHYRTTRQDTTIHTFNSNGTQPNETCELSVNGVRKILKLITVDTIGYDIGCGKRASYSKKTLTHDVLYCYDLRQ